MSRDVVVLTASPSPTSRSTFVARLVAAHAERAGYSVRYFAPGDFSTIAGERSRPRPSDESPARH